MKRELFFRAVELGAIAALTYFAFPDNMRKEIFERDEGTCQESGVSFYEGWMVHAAHFPEMHGNNDSTDYGRLLSVKEHLLEHIRMYLSNPGHYTKSAIRLLLMGIKQNGYHTKQYYEKYPMEKYWDVGDAYNTIEDMGLNPDDFC